MLACWPKLCAVLLIYLSNSKNPTSKTRRLLMRVWSKDWWDNICPALFHRRWVEGEFLDWHDSHLMTLLIQQQQLFHVSYIITPFLRHCTCITLQFQFSDLSSVYMSYRTIANHPLQSELNFSQIWSIYSDVYSDWATSPIFVFLSNLLMNRNVAPFLGELPL